MKTSVTKELPAIAIVCIPLIYLSYIWTSLPAEVPMHYDINGQVDRYGNKSELILVVLLLPILTYGIMSLVPYIDPKKQIEKMGNKYQALKLMLVAFMSIIAIYILYATQHPESMNTNMIYILVGGLFMVLGNYMKTIKANYFVGIRTPWTLESSEVWEETHKTSGYVWIIGGLLIIVGSLFLNAKSAFYLLIMCTGIITVFSIGYSYFVYSKTKGT